VNNELCIVFSETQQMVECDYDTSQTIAQQNTGKSLIVKVVTVHVHLDQIL
jgi:hypothetical protein